MIQEFINGDIMKEMILSSAHFLDKNKQAVDALNVFPVPDGDTGTNMAMTMMAAAKEVQSVGSSSLGDIAEALSKGALKGARGNSGVILSQLFRGFARSLKDQEKVSTAKYAEALQAGVDTAYKAVMKPVEGTILTVARVTAEEAKKIARIKKDFVEFYDEIIKVAKKTLDKTPELLPVLRQAGVVDSGGMGLLYIMIGASRALKGETDFISEQRPEETFPGREMAGARVEADIRFGYCTEFFIKNLHPHVDKSDIEKLKEKLEKLGDSIVVVGDEDLIKVHVHSNMPGKILQLALRFGELSNIKIDNMREQHRHLDESPDNPGLAQEKAEEPEKDYGVVAVAMGEGLSSIFRDLGVDSIIEGGQTMNPSIDDILKGVEKVKAREVFILPNNSNIILSANQAREISNKKIHVIPTKSIPQGIAAMVAFNPELDASGISERMTDAISRVKTGQVTYAVRDSVFNDIEIKKGNIIGLVNGEIKVVGQEIPDVTERLVDEMVDSESEIVTLFYGEEVSAEDAERITDFISDRYPDLDVELYSGGQPLYYYIISVE